MTPSAPVTAIPGAFIPTPQQRDIFQFVQNPAAGNLVIEAVAGSGKTSTIVKAISYLPPRRRVAFMAFNRAIADELKRKLPGYVTVSTMHGLAFRSLRRRFPESAQRTDWLDSRKPNRLIDLLIDRQEISLDDAKRFGSTAVKLLGYARQFGIPLLAPDQLSTWHDLVDRFEVENTMPAFERETLPTLFRPAFEPERLAAAQQRDRTGLRLATECAIELARRLLTLTVETVEQVIDFDDMLYLPLRFDLPLDRYDCLFVDEAQDTNHVQRALLHKMLAPGGRLVAVGDYFQAIYGFRGADSEALPAIEREFHCTRLPLSVSFRCPKSVIELAREIVPGIDHRPGAPDGQVLELGTYERLLGIFRPEDLILCRNVAPLARMAFALIKAQIACQIRGKESIGAGVLNLIKKVGGKSVDDLLDRLDRYVLAETERLLRREEEERIGILEDRAEVIRIAIEHLPPDEQRVPALIAHIDRLFTNTNGKLLTLSTIHQAKGLEYDTVYLLDQWLMPSRYAKQDWQLQQEDNLRYVAFTRARQTLAFIETPKRQPEGER